MSAIGAERLHEVAQMWEADWWGACVNTFGEEAKQITYAHRMGLANDPHDGRWPCYDLGGKRVVDIGGGPASLLLKCRNMLDALVVDPCPYPDWTLRRYSAAGIGVARVAAEEWDPRPFDEVWIYNVLQHVRDPSLVVANARAAAPLLRIFEWVNTDTNEGHPHSLDPGALRRWLGVAQTSGTVEWVNENGAVGWAFYGAFRVS